LTSVLFSLNWAAVTLAGVPYTGNQIFGRQSRYRIPARAIGGYWGNASLGRFGGAVCFRQLAFQQNCQGRAVHLIALFSPAFLPAASNRASGLPDSLASVILGNS